MANEHENKMNYTVYEKEGLGQIQVADEVIAVIAALSATEVDGVESVGDINKERISRLGMKSLSKGVRIELDENGATVDLSIVLTAGSSIPVVTKNIQEKVKSSIETMAGLTVKAVNIRVADVLMEEE